MRKAIYLFIFLFLLVACTDLVKDTKIEKDTNIFISKTHGEVAIFPTFKYLGVVDLTDYKAHRKYFIWENNYENKYIVITQIIVKADKFPPNIQWINPNGAIFARGMRGAYTSIANRPRLALEKVGGVLPDCFILASEAHVKEREALIISLIVPDKMCSENYEPVMEELKRVAIINPLG